MITEEDYDTEDIEGAEELDLGTDQEPMLNLKQVNEENEDGYTGTSEDLDADEHIDVGKLSESYHDTEMGRLVLLAA